MSQNIELINDIIEGKEDITNISNDQLVAMIQSLSNLNDHSFLIKFLTKIGYNESEINNFIIRITQNKQPTSVVRLKRKGGQVVQDCDVYIGRRLTMGGWNLKDSKYKNQFNIKEYGSIEKVIILYREWFYHPDQSKLRSDADLELKGKVLGCWCVDKKNDLCHGLVLQEWVDRKSSPALKRLIDMNNLKSFEQILSQL